MASLAGDPSTDGLGPTTRSLLNRFLAAGDDKEVPRDLLIRLDRNYLQPLDACLARAGLPAADREDVLSQIWLSLAEGRIRSYDPARGKFRSWLFHSVARDYLGRWRKDAFRERSVCLPEGIIAASGLDGTDAAGAWEAACMAHSVLDAVVRMLDALSRKGGRRAEKRIDILTLVWVEGRDPEEAGRRVGILQTAVRYHLRRARRQLLELVLLDLWERDLCGGPFEAHIRRLAQQRDASDVDGLVRGAARYLLDSESAPIGTTLAVRQRISPGPEFVQPSGG